MNNKHKILEWYNDNLEYIADEYDNYYIACRSACAKYDIVFSDAIEKEAKTAFMNKLVSMCALKLALDYEECYNTIEEQTW